MKKILFSLALVAGVALSGMAQAYLSLDSAIARAIAYNYDIRIASVATEIADANNTVGNAGLLPNINGVANISQGFSDTRLVTADGKTSERNGAKNLSYSAGVSAGYTVFAGGRAWLLKKQLGQQVNLASAQFQTQVQSTISSVIQAYAAVVNASQQAVAIDTAMALAKARMDLSKAKYDIGSAAKVDYLQARVDYNAARSARLGQQASLVAAYSGLNNLMGDDAEDTYPVADSLELDLQLTPADSSLLINQSPALEAQKINAAISNLNLKIAKSSYWPTITANLGYNYSKSESDASLLLSNRAIGPSGGLGLNVPIFQGGNIQRQVKVASLNALAADLQVERLSRAISRDYRSAWSAYSAAVAAYQLEAENRGFAHENLSIQQARFRVGVATSLELREAENSYVATLARYYAAAYTAKAAETKVLEIEARLGK
ncbi:MAG: TolC family protein [Bacteroidetes bacterium]|nr:TolC family protein [Bacteroidota bacterium]